jgi:hypothetical protein
MEDQVIILDIDETLVHTFQDITSFKILKPMTTNSFFAIRHRIYNMTLIDVGEPIGSGDVWEMWGIEREGLIKFLKYCFQRFTYVIIWSAGQKKYVQRLSERLFRWSDDPHLILSWDDCRKSENMYDKPITYLKNIMPAISGKITLQNTFIIDDRQDNFNRANKNNGIPIPPYNPDPTLSTMTASDDVLEKLIIWFDRPEVRKCKDIRKLPKNNIW